MIANFFRKSLFRSTLIVASLAAGLGASAYADSTDAPTPQPHSDSVGTAITDAAITSKVKSKFVGDDRLKKSDISVTTTNGVVTLTGTAYGPDAKAGAEILASGVDGVKDVDDNLQAPTATDTGPSKVDKATAKTKRVASDSWITTKVKSEITADSLTKGFDVSVTTTHGVVVLKGVLTSQGAIDHVKDLAEKVKGVKSVDTALLTVSGA
jgi:hyperosmotically inducible protein